MTEEKRENDMPQSGAEGMSDAEQLSAKHPQNFQEGGGTPQLKVSYKGEAPYIFISYAHKNGEEVYRIIANLQQEGYRVWYDDGIDPGIEWAENIAARVSGCAYFIAFITKEYVESSNCQDELSYARDQEKPRLLVYLENTPLPPGMSMRLNRLQAIHKYTYQNEESFYEKLYMADGIKKCLFSDGEDGRNGAVNPVQATVRSASEGASADPVQPQPAEEHKEKKKGGRGRLIGGIAAAAVIVVAAALILLPGKKNYYDMKNFAWNMAQEDAVAAWSEKPAEEGIADNGLKYVSYANLSVAGYDASAMNLYFTKDGLSLVEYRLSEGDYQTICDDLYDQYGRPSGETDEEAYWEIEEGYRIGVHDEEDGVCLHYQIPYVSYYNMQGFAFDMSMEEAKKAAEAAGMIPKEDAGGISSTGQPYFRYESVPILGYDAWEDGNTFLAFDMEGLCAIQYQLQDGVYGDIYDELEAYYGEPVEKGEGNVIWEAGGRNYIRLRDGEDRDVLVYQNYEDTAEIEIPYWNWRGITLNKTSREEAKALMAEAGLTPRAEVPEGINGSGFPYQVYEGGALEISEQQPYETWIWFNMEGAQEIQYRFEGDIYQELCQVYTAFYGEPDAEESSYIRWSADGGSTLQIHKYDTYTSADYYTKATDRYWNLQGLTIGSTSLSDARTKLDSAGLTPYEGGKEGVETSGMVYLSYQDVELMGRTAYKTDVYFDTNGFNRVIYRFKDGSYQEVLDELVAYYGESTWSDGRIGWSMSNGRWMDIVKSGSGDEYYIRCATNSSKGFYDLRGFKFGTSVEEVQAAASKAELTVMEEAAAGEEDFFIKYGTLSYAGYEDCELTAEFNEENVLTWLVYRIPQAVYNDVCSSLDELYGASEFARDGSYKVWTTGENSGERIAVYNTDANADAVKVWIY